VSSLQPLLHDAVVLLAAPTQVWSRPDGTMTAPIDGVYHAQWRVLTGERWSLEGQPLESLGGAEVSAGEASFTGLRRGLPGEAADPRLLVTCRRRVTPGSVVERFEVRSGLPHTARVSLVVGLQVGCSSVLEIKSGHRDQRPVDIRLGDGTVAWGRGGVSARLDAPGATIGRPTPATATASSDATLELTWMLEVPPNGRAQVSWKVHAQDDQAVFDAPVARPVWTPEQVPVHREGPRAWVARSLQDLDALWLTPRAPGTGRPEDTQPIFPAGGAPWFLTLFGRDALWTSRFLMGLDADVALGTLAALARFQGRTTGPVTEERPGKIPHEVRSPDPESHGLPPRYYGSVDATPLWIITLAEAWRAGADEAAIRQFLPSLQAALAWLRDTTGDGFLRYRGTGRGLGNQGWKDSGDAIRRRDGSVVEGSIALSEVQGYAFQAAMLGADLLDHFAAGDPEPWRLWASRLKARFDAAFWVDDAQGPYPAIALDGDDAPVSSVASNMGHLLGTGIVDDDQAGLIARRLLSPGLNSGFGLRTLSSDEAAYWPLGYHIGSVWPHDTTIAVLGLASLGFRDEAADLADGLERAARHFGWRLPELWGGDGPGAVPAPTPYPAACRPINWAAATPIALAFALPGWG